MKALVSVLVAGLVLRGGAAYLAGGMLGSPAKTLTTTVAATSSGTNTSVSGVDFQTALDNTVAPDRGVTSYSFGKGTLTV